MELATGRKGKERAALEARWSKELSSLTSALVRSANQSSIPTDLTFVLSHSLTHFARGSVASIESMRRCASLPGGHVPGSTSCFVAITTFICISYCYFVVQTPFYTAPLLTTVERILDNFLDKEVECGDRIRGCEDSIKSVC